MVKRFLFTALLFTFASVTYAQQSQNDTLQMLQNDWAYANYGVDKNAQAQAFDDLITKAEAAHNAFPNATEMLIWRGIIKSTYAGVKGGLGALNLAKAARADFEQALAQDPQALQGSAYTSLGILYAKVPGWPLAFGDKKKAEKLLQQGLTINPNGIDSNYFYGVYLMDNHKLKEAEHYFIKAQQAEPRPNRELADLGRQQEITQALQQLQQQVASN